MWSPTGFSRADNTRSPAAPAAESAPYNGQSIPESPVKHLRRCLLLMLCLILSGQAIELKLVDVKAAELKAAELKVDLGHGPVVYTAATLLQRPDVRTVVIPADVAFKRPMRYRAVPLVALLPGITPADHLQLVATDGFAAEIPAALLLNHQGSTPWLAIEDPAHPWPAPAENPLGAGPFYLVWTRPQAAGVSPEQWPYQLARIRKLTGVAERFPAIQPDPGLPANDIVRHGFAVFQRTCFACHTLNGAGDSRLGPDLNIPHNPTEYLRADLLRAYIRNPQSLRRWPQARMQGFDTQAMSDADLDAVLAYLRHMAGRKRP
jgi:mono/diheme cytochrome c family protein